MSEIDAIGIDAIGMSARVSGASDDVAWVNGTPLSGTGCPSSGIDAIGEESTLDRVGR